MHIRAGQQYNSLASFIHKDVEYEYGIEITKTVDGISSFSVKLKSWCPDPSGTDARCAVPEEIRLSISAGNFPKNICRQGGLAIHNHPTHHETLSE